MNCKKIAPFLAAVLLVFPFAAGCGTTGSASVSSSAESESTETRGYKIALIQQHQTDFFQIAVTQAAEAKAQELGVELMIVSSDQDADTQIAQIQQFTREGFDAIIFEPVDHDALCGAAKSAADAGVVVVNIISACTDWEDYGIAAISCGDNVKAGETEMQAVADLLGGKGNIAILTGPTGDSGGLARMEGYENILKNYPDIVQITEPVDCKWNSERAETIVKGWLSAYDLDAIVSENDGMAVGAGEAAGKDSGIIITGVDGTPNGIEAISEGLITGTVSQDGGTMASLGVEAAVKLLDGETLEKNNFVTPNIWIDGSNVGNYK